MAWDVEGFKGFGVGGCPRYRNGHFELDSLGFGWREVLLACARGFESNCVEIGL